MKRLYLKAVLLPLAVLVGCDRPTAVPDEEPNVQYGPGGVPGPPPWVLIDIPRMPPLPSPPHRPPGKGPPGFLSDVVAIGAGSQYSCALRSDGAAYCWGANPRGQLGDGTQAPSAVPVEVSGRHAFEQLVVGDLNACGITATGEAYCWGDNSLGQLGAGSSVPLSRDPMPVAGGHRFVQISVGLRITCGIATDGLTYCWGTNANGQLGTGTTGGFSDQPVPVANSGALGFVEVSVGFFAACARGTGGVHCWGGASYFGNGTTGAIVPTPTPAAGGANFAALAAGSLYACGLDAAGAASCWGSQTSGELGTGSTTPHLSPTPVKGGLHFASLDANNNNTVLGTTCAVSTSNEAWCWGSNREGQLGAPSSETCTFLPGGILAYDCSSAPIPVSGGLTFSEIAVGLTHTCAVTPRGDAYCWGDNRAGQLGNGTTDGSPAPVQVVGLDNDLSIGSIEVTPYLPTLILLGSTLQFTAVALDIDGVPLSPQPAFSWTSSDPGVAAIDNSGVATAVASGSATITATAPDGTTGRAAIQVRLIDPLMTFTQAYVGDGGSHSDGVVVLGGLLADEWMHAGTFPTRLQVDQRAITPDNQTVAEAFDHLLLARTAVEFEANRLRSVSPSDPRIGEMLTLAGFTYLALAENFCSGVPLDDPDVGVATDVLFNTAGARFAEALAAPIDAAHADAARVGAARAALGAGNFGFAALSASTVATAFVLNTSHANATGEVNGVYVLNTLARRVSLAELEGGNGLPFRSANDVRVPWTGIRVGFDGMTPLYDALKYPDAAAPTPLATGIEARLIQAEAALHSGDYAGFLTFLNDPRAATGLPLLADPGTANGRIDLLFRERAFWLFATGHRLGDVRRLLGFYGRSAAAELPVGPHHKSGSYGTDVNLPVPASARGAGYSGCPRTI
ncbi:MAG TPA: Ig-like domain-containing protein [Longimicrobiales bacterium]